MRGFKAKLFDLIDAARLVIVAGYEIDEFNRESDDWRGGDVQRLSCGDDSSWYFRDQYVAVVDGQVTAVEVVDRGDGKPEEAPVTIEFYVYKPIGEEDLEEETAVGLTGESLYQMYAAEFAKQDCGVDSWGDLDLSDQAVWNGMAERLQVKP